jgi:shikimate dehydrogenase
MKTFGLLGRNIEYSFSRSYFKNKFENLGIDAEYKNFDLEDLATFKNIQESTKTLSGLNVTIPYKLEIIYHLDKLDVTAKEIGAVNTIKIGSNGELIGFNTDYYGFLESIRPYLKSHHTNALILGTGGASKAVAYALKLLNIRFKYVSRVKKDNSYTYEELNEDHFREFKIIINCTPLGTHPNISEFPPIPTQYLNGTHLVYDLIYNPSTTQLMQLASERGATVVNGHKMLELQAEKSWEIWNS